MKAKLLYVVMALVLTLALVAVVAPLGNPVQASPSWWDSAWEHRQRLTFNNSGQSENLVDFPILVKLDSTRIDYTKTQDSGQDIRFVDSDNSTVLNYEIEKWDETGDSWVWVKVPQINGSSSTDHIYMYYCNQWDVPDGQNPTAVWDTNFKGVWHLNRLGVGDGPKPTPIPIPILGLSSKGIGSLDKLGASVLDSTSNNNDGTNNGATRGASGKIDNAFYFDADEDDYVEVPDSASK